MEFLSFMIFVISYILIFPSLRSSIAIDSISLSQTQSIRDSKNGIALVSQDESFELGFFSPGNSEKRYLGIWYKHIPIQTVVWVANRLNPINDSSGILSVNSTGSLVLSQNETVVWHTSPAKQAQNPVAQLLNSGNLVVKNENEENPEAYLWQSFDHPSDTLLPGMKFGWDLGIGLNRYLTAWKSPDDPSPGDFSWQIILNNYPEPFMMKGSEKYYRSGPWNGLHTSGSPELLPNPVFDYKFVTTKDEVYYTYNLKNKSVITRLVLNETNYIRRRYVWIEADRTWKTYTSVPLDYCDNYALCGAHGNCIITNSPVCQCLKGFRPKSEQSWNSMDWSAGCVRDKPLSCDDNKTTDGFIKLEGLKVPETTHTWVDYSMNLEQCSEKCLKNCSCMAYTNTDIRGSGSGCVMWFGNLIDIRQFSAGGQSLYIRMAASELDAINRHKTKLKAIVASTVAAISGMLLVACCYISKVRRSMTEKSKNIELEVAQNNGEDDDLDLPLFALSTIAIATDNFSVKIGEGGFGPVFKGRLENEQEIAVKRLSRSSGQGINEFKNEVKLIAKLQHRNLVKLLGCCIQGQEKMLVYEYMPNKSLDCFIFDQIRGKLLDWPKRFHIICGIARGLLYLHQDSRLRIIHRDLKASNILLDDKLNPKISDFGMARMFGGDQTEGNTNRVVGTYGYMAPEYAADGFFSVKSDVFSFGILLLEIICGKKNRGYYHPDHSVNLIGHAWRLWKEDRALEMIDTNIENSCIVSEVLRCIHVSLLCGQQFPEDRPNMSTVILMLGGEKELAEPKLPGFFPRKDAAEESSSSGQKEPSSTNEISITLLEPR